MNLLRAMEVWLRFGVTPWQFYRDLQAVRRLRKALDAATKAEISRSQSLAGTGAQ